MNIQEAKDKFVDILRDDSRIKDWRSGEIRRYMTNWHIDSSALRNLYDIFDEIDMTEQVKIPEFVAEWIEKCKADEGAYSLTNIFRTPRQIDEWLEKSNSNYELIYSAYVNGYELVEQTYYAKIKGWDKVKTTDNEPSPRIYWNYYEPEGVLLLDSKVNGDPYQTIATMKRWNELGIDPSNAVFEKA